MENFLRAICRVRRRRAILIGFLILAAVPSLCAQELSLQAVVTPSTVIGKNGEPVKFAIHGFIEFKSLADVFPYIKRPTCQAPVA
jgi:hypothetical protein